ncbi:valine--tRNA ligase [Fodinicurvata sp. EGI_FJ10296]|uniref:valine--tRNA ligase n=1 Tax=Fodinicurvata sp. EGI_FJ10296 TaxID=3231908 RepID=UPI0034562E4D
MLEKTFAPQEHEARLYSEWEQRGLFACDPQSPAPPFTIMMPPPNVTGSLHMGHALNHTLQDVLIRYYRRNNRDALWQPGMDHAGIATQMVVERNLAAEGTSRTALGRQQFLDRVWSWKEESGGSIVNQLRRLGTSPDWPRERFTMDEGLNAAVRKVFVDLHKKGLIYKDQRLVNWDPKLRTAISDLEVEQREIKGHLWHFRYPLADDPDSFITVATTRPETMLGDTGVAVHPDDARYRPLIGKFVTLPLVGRRIPIVADEYADPEQGSGAVKITPAHDFNDFEVGRRQSLETINIFDNEARINDAAPEKYVGMDRFDARKAIVADLEAGGFLEKIEDHVHMVPYGDRGGVPIEPWLTDQWYCDAATLAKPAIEAVESGRTKFVPANWAKTYFEWMRNIQPWCISRQLWWGHQIPAWYGPDGTVFVEETEDAAAAAARMHYGGNQTLVRDEDVLDTWFSSALWPFSTLGWPEETPELARYYPGDVLVTGFDIIFFWVARMMMMGLHVMDDVPFRTVYIHALVRDEKGQKMSKSKGNVMDPLDIADRYGADALRFTLISFAAQGRDVKMSEQRVEGYRNFATKLWNAARYCQMNGVRVDPAFDPASARLPVNRWIIGKAAEMAHQASLSLEQFRFNDSAGAIYHFTWGTFCDWYLEFTKPILNGSDQAAAAETRAVTAWVLDQILHNLNPHMPFITEVLWESTGDRDRMLISAPWPEYPDNGYGDGDVGAEIEWVVRLVSSIRTIRSEMNVPPSARIPVFLRGASDETRRLLESHSQLILSLARASAVTADDEVDTSGCAQAIVGEATIVLPLADVIDLDQERARLSKEISRAEAEMGKLSGKLQNEQFLAKAPEAVVEEQRERLADATALRDRLRSALDGINPT